MTLREKQSRFVFLVAKFILFAYLEGYELTFGDAWAKTGHKPKSFHYNRLAIDFNLFKNGEFLTDTVSHKPLGEYWKSLDPLCSWGGDFSDPDGNHYSYGEK